MYFKRFQREEKFTGESVKQIGYVDIKKSLFFFLQDCIYKIASSSARVNAVCESYYALAYKLQLDVVAVQISWQNANLSLLLKKLMRW